MKKLILFLITVLLLVIPKGISGQSIEQGLMLFKNHRYEMAEEVFKKAMQHDNNAMAAYYLGSIELERENDSLAKNYFSRALVLDKKNPYGYAGMGRYYLNNMPDSASLQFDKALSLSKAKDADLLCEIAGHYILAKTDSAKARYYLEKAISANPSSIKAHLLFGDWFLYYKNDGSNAIKHYNKANGLSPSSPEVNIHIGDLYARTANLELSQQYFQEAIKADSTYSIPYLKTANLLYRMKKYKEAKTYYEKYISLSEASATTMLRYAYSLFIAKDYADAIEILNGLKQPGKISLSYQRLSGYAYYEMAEYDSCIKALRNIIKYYPANKITAMDYEYLGRSLQNINEDSLAIKNFRKALAVDSSNINLYKLIGNIYYKSKEYSKAISAYISLVGQSTQPSVSDMYILGKAFYYNNELVPADSVFALVNNASPDYAFAYIYRARCNNQKPDSAKFFYEKFISLADTSNESYIPYYKEACYNLAYYAVLESDVETARHYYNNVLMIEPGNKEAVNYLKELKKQATQGKK